MALESCGPVLEVSSTETLAKIRGVEKSLLIGLDR